MSYRAVLLSAVSALVLAGTAAADQQPPAGQALSPELVPGAGLSGVAGIKATRYRTVRALGVTRAGSFRVDFAAGPGNKIVLVRRGAPVFRALRFTSMQWTATAVHVQGIGLANGRRVRFSAFAVDGGKRDVFEVDWQHHATLGGVLTHGSVVIH